MSACQDWTPAEDAKLCRLRAQGQRWGAISRQIKGRTPGACEARWRKLNGRVKVKPDRLVRAPPVTCAGWPRVPSAEDVERVYLTALHRGMKAEGLIP